jgi:hypothetical protein
LRQNEMVEPQTSGNSLDEILEVENLFAATSFSKRRKEIRIPESGSVQANQNGLLSPPIREQLVIEYPCVVCGIELPGNTSPYASCAACQNGGRN